MKNKKNSIKKISLIILISLLFLLLAIITVKLYKSIFPSQSIIYGDETGYGMVL